MKIKTSELTGPALDWAVAKAEGAVWSVWRFVEQHTEGEMRYAASWQDGGPIIEREEISVVPFDAHRWEARCGCTPQMSPARFIERRGPTPLIAAMRCFVASRLGDEVEIPAELT
jgi:hypothetical protein